MSTNADQLSRLRWHKFPVLNDGFVCLVDVMGDDQSVVQAARVSYGEGTRKVSDDRGLIRYLMRHRHSTPFEMAEIKLLVRVPMDCWRQWIRHRTANVNEYSTRYSLAIDAMQTTTPDAWRTQATQNRQGSGELLDAEQGAILSAAEAQFQASARELYEQRIAQGVAREQARKDLPLVDLYRGLLESRLAQPAAFSGAADGQPRAVGDSRIRLDHRAADRAAAVPLGVGSVCRLSAGRLVPLAARARAGRRGWSARLAATGKAQASEEDFLAAQDPTWVDLSRSRERDECREKLRLLNLLK